MTHHISQYPHIHLLIFVEVRGVKEALGQNNYSRSFELDVDLVSGIERLQQQADGVVPTALPFSYAKWLLRFTCVGEKFVKL